MSASSVTQNIRNIFKKWIGFDRYIQSMKIIKAENGKCSAELKIENVHLNPLNGLHGGCSALIVDVVAGLALLTDNRSAPHNFTLNMNLSYLKSATLAEEILIDAYLDKIEDNIAFLVVEIRNKSTKDLLVKASQSMFVPKIL